MPARIKIHGYSPVFPPYCAVCQKPADHTYTLEKTLSYGRGSVALTLQVPMCQEHLPIASSVSRTEKNTTRAGQAAGGFLGLFVAAGLLTWWASSGQGTLLLNILLAGFMGAGFFLIVWAATAYWLAPLLAPASVKAARSAVLIRRYWPAANQMELEFASSRGAELFIRENSSLIIDQNVL